MAGAYEHRSVKRWGIMSQAPSNCHFLRKAVLFAIRFNSSVLVNVGSSI